MIEERRVAPPEECAFCTSRKSRRQYLDTYNEITCPVKVHPTSNGNPAIGHCVRHIHMSDSDTKMAETHSGVPHGVAGAPNETALLKLMERTGYTMIQENGQRKYGGPPPGWTSGQTPRGCEVFVGKIPRDCYEDELVPVFENMGKIYELRLMMDFSGANRGYCFVMYTAREDAKRAVKELNNFQIRKGRYLGVCLSVDNCRLFVGGIPKNKTKEEILVEMNKVTEGVVDVIVYPSATDKSKNRGFAFVEYESHRAAAMARRKLIPGRIQLWGHAIAVDWAEPEQEVDEDVMSKVKILYVRNLMLSTTEESLEQIFNQATGKEGAVERVKKLRDYAFIHFRERDDAVHALQMLNGTNIEGTIIEVSLAKPVDKTEMNQQQSMSPLSTFPYATGMDPAAQILGMPAFYPAVNSVGVTHQTPTICTSGKPVGLQRTAVCRGNIRGGRGRGAAGSRGAGGVQRSYVPPHMRGYRKLPADEQLYDILPGMELTPTNPFTLKPQSTKTPSQILEEFAQKNGLGTPIYQLHSTVGGGNTGEMQLFLFKVTLSALSGTAFQPTKLCRTVDEAKNFAAEYVLMQLGMPIDVIPSPETTFQQIPSPILANVSTSPAPPNPQTPNMVAANMYQGRPIGPTVPYTLTNGAAAATAALNTDLSYNIATSQPYLMNYTGKVATVHPQSYPAFAHFGYQQY